MTRRISLPLAADTSATHCGACAYSTVYDGVDDERDPETGLHRSTCGVSGIVMLDGERDETCVAAEREHAAMVERPSKAVVAVLRKAIDALGYEDAPEDDDEAYAEEAAMCEALEWLASLGDADAQRMIGGGS